MTVGCTISEYDCGICKLILRLANFRVHAEYPSLAKCLFTATFARRSRDIRFQPHDTSHFLKTVYP